MPKCQKCGGVFPNRIDLHGVIHVLSSRRHCLICAPFGRRGPVPKAKENEMRTCKQCGRDYGYDRKKGHKPNICNSCSANQQRKTRKIKAVQYKGGSCSVCGYAKCFDALEFHHPDADIKEGTLSRMFSLSWARIAKELDKCVLLCSNCHRELHAGLDHGS